MAMNCLNGIGICHSGTVTLISNAGIFLSARADKIQYENALLDFFIFIKKVSMCDFPLL